MGGQVELYTTDFALDANGASYKGLIVVNKVKSRNMFVDIGAGFKSMVGGELKGMSKLTRDVRNELIEEAAQKATEMGATPSRVYDWRPTLSLMEPWTWFFTE